MPKRYTRGVTYEIYFCNAMELRYGRYALRRGVASRLQTGDQDGLDKYVTICRTKFNTASFDASISICLYNSIISQNIIETSPTQIEEPFIQTFRRIIKNLFYVKEIRVSQHLKLFSSQLPFCYYYSKVSK